MSGAGGSGAGAGGSGAGGSGAGGSGASAAGAAGAPPVGAAAPPGAAAAAIAVPSFREVQAAERSRAALPSNPLRAGAPSGCGGGGGGPLAMNPLAFIGGGGGAAPAAPAPALAHPPPQQQQYYYPPAAPPVMQPRPPVPPPAYAPPPPPPPRLPAPPGGAAGAPAARDPPPNPAMITVSRRQEGNPVLRLLRHARWQFGDVAPDFLLGAATAALFLSLRFHLLRPEYLHGRLRELGRAFRLRIVLVLVDAEDAAAPLADVTRACIAHEATLLCAFSALEAARYLETLKM
jgi:DNA repair protein Rad10